MKTTIRATHITLSFLFCLSMSAQIDVIDGGKVGIGTETPTYKLDVIGSINFTDSIYQNGTPFNLTTSTSWEEENGIVSYDGKVGIGTSNPQAALDISSTNAGFLPPRMTSQQIEQIQNTIEGMLIYNTEDRCISLYNGEEWGCLNFTKSCPGWNDNLLGTPCDDGDQSTGNDLYVDCEVCQGTFLDADGDGIADYLDACPQWDDTLLDTPCDDGIATTANDKFIDCNICEGENCQLALNGLMLDLNASSSSSISGSTWLDQSGNGNNATIYGPTHSEDYFDFDGANDYMRLTPNSTLENGTFTLSVYANCDNSGALYTYYPKGAHYDGRGVSLWSNEVFFGDADGSWASTSYTPNIINDWHLYTITFNGGTMRLYVDGIEKSSTNEGITFSDRYTGNPSSKQALIGAYVNSSLINYFNGKIRRVVLYNRVLTSSEMTDNYDVIISETCPCD